MRRLVLYRAAVRTTTTLQRLRRARFIGFFLLCSRCRIRSHPYHVHGPRREQFTGLAGGALLSSAWASYTVGFRRTQWRPPTRSDTA